jgi:hypothetical protein
MRQTLIGAAYFVKDSVDNISCCVQALLQLVCQQRARSEIGGTYPAQEGVLLGCVLTKGMLEAVREGDKPGVAVCQAKQSGPESVLTDLHIGGFQQGKPLISKGLQLIIGGCRNNLKISSLFFLMG